MQKKEFNSIGALTDRQLFGGRIATNQIWAERQLGLVALNVVGIVSIILLRGSG